MWSRVEVATRGAQLAPTAVSGRQIQSVDQQRQAKQTIRAILTTIVGLVCGRSVSAAVRYRLKPLTHSGHIQRKLQLLQPLALGYLPSGSSRQLKRVLAPKLRAKACAAPQARRRHSARPCPLARETVVWCVRARNQSTRGLIQLTRACAPRDCLAGYVSWPSSLTAARARGERGEKGWVARVRGR